MTHLARRFVSPLCALLTVGTNAQELVPNGGFEQYTLCPAENSRINDATPWFNARLAAPYGPGPSPDLFNACSTVPVVDVPQNAFGHRTPFDGEGYAGIVVYMNTSPQFREYLEVPLSAPLQNGMCYRLSFRMSLAGTFSSATIGGIGAHFAPTVVEQAVWGALPVTPQLDGLGSFLADTLAWLEVSALYEAQGGEQYLMLGNFHDDATTEVLDLDTASFFADTYFYIDAVSLVPVPIACGALGTAPIDAPVRHMYPNPVSDELFLSGAVPVHFRISTLAGHTVKTGTGTGSITVAELPAGMYFLELFEDDNWVRVPVVKE